jgi:hypothetical protein
LRQDDRRGRISDQSRPLFGANLCLDLRTLKSRDKFLSPQTILKESPVLVKECLSRPTSPESHNRENQDLRETWLQSI